MVLLVLVVVGEGSVDRTHNGCSILAIQKMHHTRFFLKERFLQSHYHYKYTLSLAGIMFRAHSVPKSVSSCGVSGWIN